MRTLWIDARSGRLSAATLLGALVDLGVAVSPILGAVASLRLPIEMRLDGARVAFVPEHHGILLHGRQALALIEASQLDARAQSLAADALGRMLLAEEGLLGAREASLDAGVALAVAGAAVALAELDAERYLAAADLRASPDGAALLRCLVDDADPREPRWRGPVARGSCDGVDVVLGRE